MDNLGTSYAVVAKSYICAHPLHLFIIRQMTYVVDGERAHTYILNKEQMMTNALWLNLFNVSKEIKELPRPPPKHTHTFFLHVV